VIDFKQLLNIENAFKGKQFYKIDNPLQGRRLVIPDIHGCYNTFIELLYQINFKKEDSLFLLGDYINRGKKSKEVLDKIIELINDEYTVYPLRGNHEDRLIERHLKNYTEEELKLPRQFHNKDISNENYKIKNEYLGLISNLPYYYELNDYYLVHAGFNFTRQDYLNDFKSMLWMTEIENKDNLTGKKIVVGHKTKGLNEITSEIKNNSKIIHLDNGCVYKSSSNLGNLLCINLNTNELFVQKNID